jgi:hypothetical protein
MTNEIWKEIAGYEGYFGIHEATCSQIVRGKIWKRVNLSEWMAAHD